MQSAASNTPSKVLDFYFDFTSPYAYLAALKIDQLVEQYGYTVRWHCFLVGVALGITGRKPPLQSPMVGSYVMNDLQRTARDFGVRINFPDKFPILGVKPGRIFTYLSQQQPDQILAKAFALQAYKRYFVDGKDISDLTVLQDIAADFGLTAQQASEAVRSPKSKQQFRQAVDAAIAKQVFAVPMFALDDELFWGVDHLPQLERWLKTGGW